jgi:hypothetical protein
MGWAWLYFPAGVALVAPGLRGFWSAWIRPWRDWAQGRGQWVNAQVVRAEPVVTFASPPYWARPAQLRIQYEMAGQRRSATLILQHTKPGDYTAGQGLSVFVPIAGRGRPRTPREPNYSEQRLGVAALLVLLGLLSVTAGAVTLARGR